MKPKLENLCKYNSLCLLRKGLNKEYCTKHYSKGCLDKDMYDKKYEQEAKE